MTTTGNTYESALATGRKLGAGACNDSAAMALFCASPLQTLVGAVSPKLVWEGAQASGLTLLELGRMCTANPAAVEDLMWL